MDNNPKEGSLLKIIALALGAIIIILVGIGSWLYTKGKTSQENKLSNQIIEDQSPPTTDNKNSEDTLPGNKNNENVKIKTYYVLLEDDGKNGQKIGCNDSVIGIEKEIPYTQAVLKSAFDELLANKNRTFNSGNRELYNALSDSSLKLDNAKVENTKAVIRISGDFKIGGTCDAPRVYAQLRNTALQFSTVKTVDIYINNRQLEDILSQEGA